MSNVTDDSNHVVVEAVATVGVRSMPESRAHSESSECFFESVLVIIGYRELSVVTDSCSGVVVSNVGGVVARLVDDHPVLTELCSSLVFKELLVVANGASGSVSRKASSPVVSLVHIIVSSSIGLEIFSHSTPGSILRGTGHGIVKFT